MGRTIASAMLLNERHPHTPIDTPIPIQVPKKNKTSNARTHPPISILRNASRDRESNKQIMRDYIKVSNGTKVGGNSTRGIGGRPTTRPTLRPKTTTPTVKVEGVKEGNGVQEVDLVKGVEGGGFSGWVSWVWGAVTGTGKGR